MVWESRVVPASKSFGGGADAAMAPRWFRVDRSNGYTTPLEALRTVFFGVNSLMGRLLKFVPDPEGVVEDDEYHSRRV